MVKRFLFLIAIAILLAPAFVFGAYERAVRVTATEVVDALNNFILVQDYDERYLIHHKTGCGSVKEGDPLTLVIRGELDGNQETLYKGDYASCTVDQAELITGTLVVTIVSASDTSTSVSDNGKPYRIYYSERCKGIKNMNGREVYLRKYGGSELRAGDKFFLPGAGEMCSITYVQSEIFEPSDTQPIPANIDVKRPTTPTHLRAIPTTSAVYLYWDAATDNVGIDHYVISASLYHRDDPVAQDPAVKPQEMPDTIRTQSNRPSMRIDFLEPDELYFFRVIAVDSSGNESSYWSEEATAFTKSSIAQISLENPVLRLFQAQETASSFLFRWNNLSGYKYSVALEVDNERVFADSNWTQTYIQIAKKPERKGKKLELIVRALNYRGITQTAIAKFSF
ncbi:hypothetical protein JXD20_00360 [Candidatus Peregrinibacteria bacterium]|nr:hypothetical protein [Candidatus Peregrinibacteria bacterium]